NGGGCGLSRIQRRSRRTVDDVSALPDARHVRDSRASEATRGRSEASGVIADDGALSPCPHMVNTQPHPIKRSVLVATTSSLRGPTGWRIFSLCRSSLLRTREWRGAMPSEPPLLLPLLPRVKRLQIPRFPPRPELVPPPASPDTQQRPHRRQVFFLPDTRVVE